MRVFYYYYEPWRLQQPQRRFLSRRFKYIKKLVASNNPSRGLMVMSLAFHPDDPGSIPRRNSFNFQFLFIIEDKLVRSQKNIKRHLAVNLPLPPLWSSGCLYTTKLPQNGSALKREPKVVQRLSQSSVFLSQVIQKGRRKKYLNEVDLAKILLEDKETSQ